ncbi:uncharacterized protein RCO7_11232 [Rhynchosporium graminicola]|uniref:Uncharacterized protein n=1 Tax=Rhynchosporium graminicola TaxID=2792576 RepID=A0A1E1LB30_9HELO|nr:uncharacterized protein RCO7_11232 [Rhynchosporium commune]
MAAVIPLESSSDANNKVCYGEALKRYLEVLRQAMCDAENPPNQPHFFPPIEKLENEISLQQLRVHFYNALESTKKNWLPKGNIEDVIRACVNGQCDKSDHITIEFYHYGDIHAVIALYLATKGDNNWVFAQIEALPEEWRIILIEEVKKIEINDHVPTWIRTCIKSPIRDDEETPCLNRHAPAKEKPGARRKRQRFRKTWCYGASQSSPPPIPHNGQMLPLPSASASSMVESVQSHENAALYRAAPQIPQTVDIPLVVRDDRDRSGLQQTNLNVSKESASLAMPPSYSQDTRRQEILHHQSLRQWPGYDSSQINTRMQPQLPGLQQITLAVPSFDRDQSQHRGRRQDFTTNRDYGGTINREQRHPLLHHEAVHPSSLQYKQQKSTAADSLLPYTENRAIEHMYTNAPATNITKFPEPFKTAIQNSRLWKSERSQNMKTTGCWPSLFPQDDRQDVSFTIWCGNEDGEDLTKFFGTQLEISS